MIYRTMFWNKGFRLMHSPDLDDMRRAIADDDKDGVATGTTRLRPRPTEVTQTT